MNITFSRKLTEGLAKYIQLFQRLSCGDCGSDELRRRCGARISLLFGSFLINDVVLGIIGLAHCVDVRGILF